MPTSSHPAYLHGLPSDIVQRSHRQLAIPTDPLYASLNLAQAGLLRAMGYVLGQALAEREIGDE